jgi:Ser/Thr protein kinase RdoA (MazF antagonist)
MTDDGRPEQDSATPTGSAGRRHPEVPTDPAGLEERMRHAPNGARLIAHLREHHGIDATTATQVSVHNDTVFRIDRRDGEPWIARAYPPSRPRSGAEGDAAILRFLEQQDYPAERLAADDPVSDAEGGTVLVTRVVPGTPLPPSPRKFALLGELLGRLHALPADPAASRPGGAGGEDPGRAGTPRQDLLAAAAFLDSVDDQVPADHREAFDRARRSIGAADDGSGLPEGLLHGNMLHAPDHALLVDDGGVGRDGAAGSDGAVGINWKSAGRGPRLADLAFLLWGTWLDEEAIAAAVTAYRRHAEPTAEELDRLEGVMRLRPLYLMGFDVRRSVLAGRAPETGMYDPAYIGKAATAVRAAFRARAGRGLP